MNFKYKSTDEIDKVLKKLVIIKKKNDNDVNCYCYKGFRYDNC